MRREWWTSGSGSKHQPAPALDVNQLAVRFYQAYYASLRERPGFPGWSAEEWIRWTDDDNLRPAWSLLIEAEELPLGFVTAGVEHVER